MKQRVTGRNFSGDTVDELLAKYSGEWLALRVTQRDSAGQPKPALALAHAPTRAEVHQKVRRLKDVCLLYAGPAVPEGFEVLF
jgi:hypothetical protein